MNQIQLNPSTQCSAEAKSTFDQLHKLSKEILVSRGLQSDTDLQDLLDFTLSKLQDPSSIMGMDRAVARLFEAWRKQEAILIYGDYDLDGSSGVCILKMALDRLGFQNVRTYQPDRHKEGYGLHAKLISGYVEQGISLILTVDLGITAIEAAEECLKHQIDLVITDHHLPQEILPRAYVVVNPNQAGDVSDLKFLCGAGVGFYLVRALKRKWSLENLPHASLDLKSLLPYVVLSTVTDMVPLIKDNRILVKHGLDAIEKTSILSWKELLKKFTYGKKRIQVSDVAISIAPKLNALTRMSGELTPVDYLLSEHPDILKERLDYLVAKNKEREEEQSLAQNIANDLAKVRDPSEPFLFVADSQIHLGVLGLVANRISQEDEIPVFVAGKNEEGLFVGSARLPENREGSLLDVLGFCDDELIRFGGHSHAAGFMFEESKTQLIREKLRAYYIQNTYQRKKQNIFTIPAQLDQFFEPDFIRDLEMFAPYGKGFEPFTFMVSELRVIAIQKIKDKHLKLVVADKARRVTLTAWLFSASKTQMDICQTAFEQEALLKVRTQVQMNEFRGKVELQLLVQSVED